MAAGLARRGRCPHHGAWEQPFPCPQLIHPEGDLPMQWQTPTATDLRFGFEITMYVAAR